MTDPSETEIQTEPPQIRFLRRLVTTLTVVMIGGLVVIISLLVIRLQDTDAPLPAEITLPEGVEAEAVTLGRDWIAVVSQDNRILIFDRESGALRQEVQITD
ncbi:MULTISPECIES: DUF6476 family protein [unclassified Leisingera]|uniref:DUF6476 family protein n=1 Tax=unclassified Leisingera TaxID=2614906 RepID=UPI0002DB0D02|nr:MULTISPECIES: DUF6476 family protein [unclassified Leisingera]KIC16147.1 hypothetical protein RA21_13990 [Leisingera sp. ANG-DT]KIC26009.1 hypothetical protein RA23_03415 [Leisingera sp. ANG-S3]KIC30265.1 hypothetical protein RA24_02805 [Leisingera sp. ANG-M6]KIC31955.1 hypothetical protein RA25_14520 [Leisingera sp. ANG-S5]KIC53263.1 hypothetical protein RA22_11440 [Leisingera sp. ANG-S]